MQQFFSRIFSQGNFLFWAFVFSLFSTSVFAAPPTDVASLVSSINFADVVMGILAIAGSIVGIYVSWKGAQFVIKQVRGA